MYKLHQKKFLRAEQDRRPKDDCIELELKDDAFDDITTWPHRPMSWKTFVINTLKPSNAELRSVIENALWKNYKNVQVTLTTCPDLSKPPFRMTANGFGRNLSIAEVGGMGNLFPILHKEKDYDIKIASKATIQHGEHTSPYKSLTIDSPKFNLMANLAISEEPGPAEVVHVKCSERIGEENLPRCIRKGLAWHYGQSCVSLAGIFLLLRGEADVHIVPDYPPASFRTMDEVESWFNMFKVKAPLVCATVFHSYDPGNNLRMEHTHCYSDHQDGGHYHIDTTPETVEYEGWFTAAEKIYRVDQI
ncbi:hypothetical protein TELCIR_07934 [Teladorsagia circumcincta]|uniref:DUF1907 domain-containing protein n=1 Tax=Teladorsagia circumcincta TaxID=45464 RepID=A0A2G9UKF8_TELCI|nr:hypothetical protein TELCIR_07934 [Teladorsagia circumcincta]